MNKTTMLGIASSLLLTLAVPASASEVRDIRGGAHQLFLDDWIVAQVTSVERCQGQPIKRIDNPILRRDKPWDAARCDLYGSAVLDLQHKRIQLFYSANNVPNGHEDRLAYAESLDGGETWVKPAFDRIPFNGHSGTNLVMLPPSQTFDGACVFRDEHAANPAQRYKLFTSSYPDTAYLGLPRIYERRGPFLYSIANPTLPPNCDQPGMFVAYSPDGIHWQEPALRFSNMLSDTAASAFWDKRISKYVAYVRARSESRRSVARMESNDFEHWGDPVVVLEGKPDRELYSMGVNQYEGIYIGTPWIFVPSANSTDKPVIWPELTSSRDGIVWSWPFQGTPLVPCGSPGSADSRQIRMSSSFVVLNDRILLFYGQTDRPHIVDMRVDIGMATLRRDGFAAMKAGEVEGAIITKPVQFGTGRLCVNAKVSSGGYLHVELRATNGAPLSGYDLASCEEVHGDVIRAPIVWKKQGLVPVSDISQPCQIRFVLKNAQLYSFWIE